MQLGTLIKRVIMQVPQAVLAVEARLKALHRELFVQAHQEQRLAGTYPRGGTVGGVHQ